MKPINEIVSEDLELEVDGYQGTKKAISNAWRNGTIVDSKGYFWINKDMVHVILRTTKLRIPKIVMGLEAKHKMIVEGKTYLRSYKVLELLSKSLEESTASKANYLKGSLQCYSQLNELDQVKLLRMEYQESLDTTRKQLKRKRIRKYMIKQDELTNEPLINSEFSHIRSVAAYQEFATHIENGLIVNKEIHALITQKGVQDEEDLIRLCEEQGWSTSWYKAYKEIFV